MRPDQHTEPDSRGFLYKYIDHYAENVIENLELKVTPPNEFNDPFEFSPSTPTDLSIEQAKRLIERSDIQDEQYRKMAALIPGLSREQFDDYLRQERDSIATGLSASSERLLATYRQNQVHQASQQIAILCLSNLPDQILMWSHYAAKHKGFVLGLHADHEFFQKFPKFDVDYGIQRVLFDWSFRPGSVEERRYAEQLVKRKSRLWKYEKEVRLMFPLQGCRREELADKPVVRFWPMPRDLVGQIIFGCRCPNVAEQRIRGLVEEKGLHVVFERASMHDSEFKLVIKPA